MSAISRPLTPKPDRPVEPIALLVIQEVHKASRALTLPVFLVGAMARIILLEHVHGLPPGRATKDVDFAFALDNWDQFTAIKAFLLRNADFEESKHVAHRLHFRPQGLEHHYKVDLIPFGGIETGANTIAWPPDTAVMMNVAGFGDALAAAVSVAASPGISIAVASLPGIAILKLFAWADRGQENPKDAIDLVLLLRSYSDAGNAARIYEEASALAALEAAGYDLELAGAWLLGSDAAVIGSAQIEANIADLLSGPKKEKLIEDMARAMLGRHDALDYSRRLLEQFTKGFTA